MLFCRFLNAKPNYHHVSSVTSLSQNIKKPLPQEEAGSLAIWRTSEHKVLKFLRVHRVLAFLEWADKRWRYHLIQGPLEPLVPSEPFPRTESSHISLNLIALQSSVTSHQHYNAVLPNYVRRHHHFSLLTSNFSLLFIHNTPWMQRLLRFLRILRSLTFLE